MSAEEQKQEVILLTLKKWGIPQMRSIAETKSGTLRTYGKYVSFQSHHFIDVKRITTISLSEAFDTIQRLRDAQYNQQAPSPHIVQSLTLIGPHSDYWNSDAHLLYVTFIQVTGFDPQSFDTTRVAIGEVFKQYQKTHNGNVEWAIYFSYDFSDLILFAKNIPLDDYHELLWEITLGYNSDLNYVRDTYTIYCIQGSFLKKSFQSIEAGKKVSWDCKMALQINLNVYSDSAIKRIENKFQEMNVKPRELRSTGRFDASFVTEMLTGEQILEILYILDNLHGKSEYQFLGGYEIVPISPAKKAISVGTPTPKSDISFKRVSKALLYTIGHKKHDFVDAYIKETARSLEELVENGFSTEFVLSVLPSFVGVSRIFEHNPRIYKQKNEHINEQDRLNQGAQEYFNALNTLTLCTMHGERRFIQAPAFCATYFDIPPKLLAFYGAVTQLVLHALQDGDMDSDDYQFLITPDYRSGINVLPVSRKGCNQKLAIIHLTEKYFYDPIKSIYLLCHEIAHYSGNRYREDRARGIFFFVSAYWLINSKIGSQVSGLNDIDLIVKKESLLGILADSFSAYLEENYKLYIKQNSAEEEFSLMSIMDYLQFYEYGLEFLKDSYYQLIIIEQWKEKMIQANGEAIEEAISAAITTMQGSLSTDYMLKMYNSEEGRAYACEILAASLVRGITDLFLVGQEAQDDWFKFYETVVFTFREAFSDIRMIEIIGKSFSYDTYKSLLTEMNYAAPKNEIIDHTIRYNAVKDTVGNETWDNYFEGPLQTDSELWPIRCWKYLAAKIISEYLSTCNRQFKESEFSMHIEAIVKTLEEGDLKNHFDCVMKEIDSYKNWLTYNFG